MHRAACTRVARIVLLALVCLPVSATVCLALCGTAADRLSHGHHGQHGQHGDEAAAVPGSVPAAAFDGMPAEDCFGSQAMLHNRAAALLSPRTDAPPSIDYDGGGLASTTGGAWSGTSGSRGLSPPPMTPAGQRPLIALRI